MTTFVIDAHRTVAERQIVLTALRGWLGTPFHHRACIRGVGVDCAQLLVAGYCDTGLVDRPLIAFYSRDWFLHEKSDRFAEMLCPAFAVTTSPMLGDLVLFRYGRCASHAGVLSAVGDEPRVIHSFRDRGVVEEECAPLTALGRRIDSVWMLKRWTGEAPCPA